MPYVDRRAFPPPASAVPLSITSEPSSTCHSRISPADPRECTGYGEGLQAYRDAFITTDADAAQLPVVATDGADVVSTMRPSSPNCPGALRAPIEAVRVHGDQRRDGLGNATVTWAIKRHGAAGAPRLQVTNGQDRTDALRL